MKLILNQENTGVPMGVGSIGVFTDDETGVEYFVYHSMGTGSAICPRYNADGSLMINSEFAQKKEWQLLILVLSEKAFIDRINKKVHKNG